MLLGITHFLLLITYLQSIFQNLFAIILLDFQLRHVVYQIFFLQRILSSNRIFCYSLNHVIYMISSYRFIFLTPFWWKNLKQGYTYQKTPFDYVQLSQISILLFFNILKRFFYSFQIANRLHKIRYSNCNLLPKSQHMLIQIIICYSSCHQTIRNNYIIDN